MKSNSLPENKKTKVHITPAQQMLNRFEALQKVASSASVKQSSSVDTSVVVKQSASHTDSKFSNSTVALDGTKVTCATKPKLGDRVAHKPKLVRM